MIPVNYKSCFKHVVDILMSGSIPMLYGKPGAGKSSLAADIAQHLNLLLVDIRLSDYEPPDINGFMRCNEATGRGEYVPMDLIPIEGDKLPINPETKKQYDGWLIFFDEITNAEDPVLKVIYKVLQDRIIAGMRKIHPRAVMMAAGNLGEEDGSMANVMPTTLQSRLMSLSLSISGQEWVLNEAKYKAAPNVLAYISSNPDMIHKLDMDSYNDVNFPCHRNWSRLSRYLNQIDQTEEVHEDYLPPIAGAIGQSAAHEFVAFSQIYKNLPDPQKMLQEPLKVDIPHDNPALCAIMTNSVIPLVTKGNLVAAVELFKRFDGPIHALAMRSMISRFPHFIDEPAIDRWIKNEGKYLVV